MMNIKNKYSLLIAFSMICAISGMHGMQPSDSLAQKWYKPHLQNNVTKLNTSFAQLIGAVQDQKSREDIRKHADITVKELKNFNQLVEQFGWCPQLIDRAAKEIQKFLIVTDASEHEQLERNFTIAQDMKNWLLASCDQTEKKHQSSEYSFLKLLLIEKQHYEARLAHIHDKQITSQTMSNSIESKRSAQELSFWGGFWLSIYESMPHLDSGHYKTELLNKEIALQEKQLEKQLIYCDDEIKSVDLWKEKEIQRLQKECSERTRSIYRQIPTDLVFKNKETGQPNIFFEVILQLFSAPARKDILIGEQFFDTYSPIRNLSRFGANCLAFLGFVAPQGPQAKSTGHKVGDVVSLVDTLLVTQNTIGELPMATACKCLSMLLASHKLQDVVVGVAMPLGKAQEVRKTLNELIDFKKSSNDIGLSLNDLLEAAKFIGNDRLGIVVRICCKAIKKQPEKFAGYVDSISDYVYGSSKTAQDDDDLLSYVAVVNEESYVAPIREVRPTWSEALYNSVLSKKTVAVIGGISLLYGGYRYDMHKTIIQKAQEFPIKDSLATVGAWMYNLAPTLFKK